eukprot:3419069-Prymnesium_polylepis.1
MTRRATLTSCTMATVVSVRRTTSPTTRTTARTCPLWESGCLAATRGSSAGPTTPATTSATCQ